MESSTIFIYSGFALNIFGLLIAGYGIYSGNRIKKLILNEKDMIRNNILDITRRHISYIDIVRNDRITFNDPSRNVVNIRIEDLQAGVDNLNRFAEALNKIK